MLTLGLLYAIVDLGGWRRWAFPAVVVGMNSIAAYALIHLIAHWTLENYRALADPVYVRIILNSLWLAAQNTIVCLLVGYAVAYILAFRAGRMVGPLILLLVIPFWASFLVRMSAWMTLLSPGGIADSALRAMRLIGEDTQLIPSNGAVLIGLLYVFLPSAVFPIYAAMSAIPHPLLDAAGDLGCGSVRTHALVIVPLALKGLAAAVLFVFAPSLRVFFIPILPVGARWWAPVIGILAVIGIIYGALGCLAQTDMKRLIAFSSVAHMGYVMLGIATLTPFGINAAIFGMVAHGLITGLLFFIAGSTKERFHTLEIKRLGGLLLQAPHMGWLLAFATMASLGLPGLAGFWGEFPAILSAYSPAEGLPVETFRTYMVIAAIGTVLALSLIHISEPTRPY